MSIRIDSVDGVRYVSAHTNVAVLVSASITVLMLLIFRMSLGSLFPDTAPISWDVWARGHGATKSEAMRDFSASGRRLALFLKTAGIPKSEIAQDDFAIDRSLLPPGDWEASQRFIVPGDSYARFSTLSNEISKLDPAGTHISSSFPPIPFQALITWIIVFTLICLCFSVASIEFRAGDVAAAPRGMHPIVILTQTAMYALAIMSAVAYVHLNALVARTWFITLTVLIVGSLAAWLFRSRLYWRQSAFLQRAYVIYLAGAVFVVASLVAAIIKGPT